MRSNFIEAKKIPEIQDGRVKKKERVPCPYCKRLYAKGAGMSNHKDSCAKRPRTNDGPLGGSGGRLY